MKNDDALIELYNRLKLRHAAKPGSFSALTDDGRRAYFTTARRRNRAKERANAAAGAPSPTQANIRDALADAALMILATGAPGIDQVRIVLGAVFSRRPGVPMKVEQSVRSGKLRPKLATSLEPQR